MSDNVQNNKRIAKNTIMMYFRMIIMMIISLYTSRVILQTLGVVDYGIYNVVGGIVGLLGFISGSMSLTVQRFFSFDLGRNDKESLNRTYSMALQIYILVGFVTFIAAEIAGYFLLPTLQIPEERMSVAIIVFHLSVLTAIAKLMITPLNALIISYERMSIFAYLSIAEAVLGLGVLFVVQWISRFYDSLKLYAILMLFMTIIIMAIYYLYCNYKIKDVKYRFTKDKEIFKRLIGFTSWTTLGEFAWCGTIQGVNLISNSFFGPVINASRGIAYHIQIAVMRFVQNFQVAVNPQIIKYYANKERDRMTKLAFRSTCFSFYLTILLSLPLILRMDYVLKIWLGQIPDYSIIFSQLIIINIWLDVISNLLVTIIKATGHIRNYYIISSAILLLNPLLTYTALKLGASPNAPFYIYSGVSIMLLITRLFAINKLANIEIYPFAKDVLYPIAKHIIIVFPLVYVFNRVLPEGILSLLLLYLVTAILVCTAIYIFDLSKSERQSIINKIKTHTRK